MAKFIPCHGASVYSTIGYLTKDGRAVAADYINCWEVDRLGRPVWRQMDECRHALCGDMPRRSIESTTWLHIIVSPDPKDRVDLSTLRELACAWGAAHFGAYQVAIYYHDDNTLRIPHAHMVVNNVNLCRHRRVTNEIKLPLRKERFRSLQEMAAERGLSVIEENRGKWRGMAQATYRSKHDLEIEAKGISWKRDVRDRISCAIALSSTERDYLEALRCLGLDVRLSEGAHTEGEYVYRHPTADFGVIGMRLGRDWSREGICARLERDRVLGVDKPLGPARDRLLKAISALEAPEGAALQVLGVTHGMEVTARMVADMVETCAAFDVRSAADMAEALEQATDPADLSRLEEADRLARALGHLPQERSASDGARTVHARTLAAGTEEAGSLRQALGQDAWDGRGMREQGREAGREPGREACR